MFTDKQSLILCAIIVFGFSISGIFGILDNFVVVAVLILLFLLVVINLFIQKPIDESVNIISELEDKKDNSPNIFNNENI